ncbi:Transmembrane transcriptional regulator (anti-sigma factor RsiW) [Enhydrobacter aerosaccus]|uniref:Transmembrane transcriptional regulator (Anti-sigma factor RsiW) n=1 Tax=Enhydrobacter aerosaccus TaxID=225324 RepID=A0A1T4NMU0_9HYPH|nr:anti-sigma factor [Enhydrobacter aerosaccus]SJZ80058.1 Transmembrane transcriptional regulator (anti-sigma factor RsiW) [Enhydrobacter aerosaccus]
MTGDPAAIVEDDLQAYVDGRLTGERLAAVEAHLAQHPDLRERLAIEQRQRAQLRGQLEAKFAEPIPARLRIANIRAARRHRWLRGFGIAAAGLLLFAAGAGAGWFIGHRSPDIAAAPATSAVAQNAAVAYRTYVVEVAHPVEVDAQHQAHLLQWLSRRLGKPLVAPDLAPFGYRLMGGRLLPAGSGAAAQLMYDDASGKRLTVYVRAAEGSETAFRFQHEGEASTFAWIDQGFGFAVTGMLPREELLPIAEAVYHGFAGDADTTRKN